MEMMSPRKLACRIGRNVIPIEPFEDVTWPYRLMVPLMYAVGVYTQAKKFVFGLFGKTPRTNSWFFDGISASGRAVKEGAARWPALDVVYNFKHGVGKNKLVRTIDSWWLHIRNAQAVRNRLKIVEQELAFAACQVFCHKPKDDTVCILSLAAGSGQAVIETVALLERVGVHCFVVLVDQDATALDHARTLALKYGVESCVKTYEANVFEFAKVVRSIGFQADIVEMCGLMDYLDDRKAEVLMKKIHKYLPEWGFFLTCHIHPNAEQYFLRHTVDWDMLYRTKGEFHAVLVRGGFAHPELHTEPHGIHSVAVMQKG